MSEPATISVNCGRCAHLWKRTRPGLGVCGCRARRDLTGEVNPAVSLDGTCEFSQLSAKYDPDFMARIYEQRRQGIPEVSLLTPTDKPLQDYDKPPDAPTTCFLD